MMRATLIAAIVLASPIASAQGAEESIDQLAEPPIDAQPQTDGLPGVPPALQPGNQRERDIPSADEVPLRDEDQGFIDWWIEFIQGEGERVLAMNPYGASFTLPQGYLKIQYAWDTLRAKNRFGANGAITPVLPNIEFEAAGSTELSVDLGLRGKGGSHFFQLGYGITDTLDVYLEVPFTWARTRFKPKANVIDSEGNTVGPTAARLLGVSDRKSYDGVSFFYETLPKLGRPTPDRKFAGDWLVGDIVSVVAWNYFRGENIASGLLGRLFWPSARIPPPDKDLFYGAGPDLQAGTGAWGLGLSHLFDVKVLRWEGIGIDFSAQFDAAYRFDMQRAYPTNFTVPEPIAAQLSAEIFPDLSHLDGSYNFTPGVGLGMGANVVVSYLIFGVGVGWGYSYAQKPELRGDEKFLLMVDSLGLVAEQMRQVVTVGLSINLLGLGVPARIAGSYEHMIDGRNLIIYDDHFKITADFFLPMFLAWQD